MLFLPTLNPILTKLGALSPKPPHFISLLSQKKYRSFLGSCMILFCVGQRNMIGTLYLYMVSYFRQYDPTISIASTSVLGNSCLILGLFALCSIRLSESVGFTKYVRVLAIIDTLCTLLCPYIKHEYSLYLFYVFLPMFIGNGMLYMPIVDNLWNNNFPNKGQLFNIRKMTGILFASQGSGQIFFNYFMTKAVNPDNVAANIEVLEGEQTFLYFSEEVYNNIPSYMNMQFLIQVVFEITGAFLMTSSKDKEYYQYIEEDSNQIEQIKQKVSVIDDRKLKDCLQSDYFLTIFLMCILIYLPGCFVNLNYKSFILNRINDDQTASLIATLSCLSLIVGRVVSGILYDKMKIMDLLRQFIFFLLQMTQGFFSKFFRYFLLLLTIGHTVLYMIGYTFEWIIFGMMLVFFADGGQNIVVATSFNSLFHKSMAGKVYSFKGLAIQLCFFFIGFFQNTLFKMGWTIVQIHLFLIQFAVIALFIGLQIQEKYNIKGSKS